METKQITLRSQTVQCPHCGEYYSVTYKYCPFCDVGRQEEERKMAERKKQRQQKLGGLFGSEPEKKKKRPSEPAPQRESARREPAPRKEAHPRREAPVQEHKEAAPVKPAPKKKESLFFSKPTRKKTSEMTEEEKKAYRAEREARAAERKRERDRLAREAALAAGAPDPIPDLADTYEAPTPETFELAEVPAETPEAVVLQEVPAAEAPPVEETPAVEIPVAQETPVEPAPAPEEAPAEELPADPGSWAHLRELEMTPNAPVVEVSNEPVLAETVQPQPTVSVQAEPAPPEKPVETEEDLDALLSEIRDLLADSPVPAVAPDQLKKPVQPVVQAEIPTEGGARLAPEPAPVEAPPVVETVPAAEPEVVPVAEPAPVVETPVAEPAPVVEEPTIVIPTSQVAQQAAAGEASMVDEAPTQVLPVEEIQTLESQAETPVAAAPIPEPKEAPAPKKQAPKKKKKSLLPVILSLILIAAAAFIVVKTVAPAFQDGLLSGQSANAETLTLDKEELTFAEAGATAVLTPVFTPEGTSAPITWTTSDEAIATVDEKGTVTAVAKGIATITATLENGQTAQAVVNCTWEDAAAQPAEGEDGAAEGDAPPAGPALSSSSLTLDGEGKTKQLQVTGAEGAVKWTTNKTDVATVAEDGTVTAVAKGSAIITAEVDGKALTCEVRCIW